MEDLTENDDTQARLEELMTLARDNQEELQVRLQRLLEELSSLKRQLESIHNDDAFQIDTNPIEDIDATRENDFRYEAVVNSGVLSNFQEDEPSSSKKENIIKNSCFNCEGDHQLPDCPHPKDHRRIAQNRREFLSNTARSTRYHIDDNQKFGQLQPGLPSARLREALGIQEDQLPSYIYRMRELGLPPGWLKAAEINHSGLGIYVEKNRSVPEASEEEGEISDPSDKIQYDLDRLPEWPGFNVAAPDSFRDESRKYNAPQMKDDQLKSHLISQLKSKAQKGYVRKEMSSGTQTPTGKRTSPEVPEAETPVKVLNRGSRSESPMCNPEVVNVDHGTPIVKLYSPFTSLPSHEKWTTNTTDHIFFENLPESTGNYEKLRGILDKIRQPHFPADEQPGSSS